MDSSPFNPAARSSSRLPSHSSPPPPSSFANLRIVEEDRFTLSRLPSNSDASAVVAAAAGNALDSLHHHPAQVQLGAKKWIGGFEWELSWMRRQGGSIRLSLRCVDCWPAAVVGSCAAIGGEYRALPPTGDDGSMPSCVVDMWFFERSAFGERLGKPTRKEFKVGMRVGQQIFYHRAECGVFLRVMQPLDQFHGSPFVFRAFAGEGRAHSSSSCSEVTIVVGKGHRKRRFYVRRESLLAISPVFQSMLRAGEDDAVGVPRAPDSSELRVDGVDPDDFLAFLLATIPVSADDDPIPVTPDNALSMLKLAHHFNVAPLRRQCEKRLLNAREVPLLKRLAACDRHGMDALLSYLLQHLSKSECRRMVREALTSKDHSSVVVASLSPRLLIKLHKKYHGLMVAALGDGPTLRKHCAEKPPVGVSRREPKRMTLPPAVVGHDPCSSTASLAGTATAMTTTMAMGESASTMGAMVDSGCRGGGGSSGGNKEAATAATVDEKPLPSFYARWLVVEEAEVAIHLHSIPSAMRKSAALLPSQQQSVKAEVMKVIGGWQWKLSLTCHAEVSLVQLSCSNCSSYFDTTHSEVTAIDYSLFHYPSQESREDAVEVSRRRVERLDEGVVENVVVRLDEIYGSGCAGGNEGEEEAMQQLTTFAVFVRVLRERKEMCPSRNYSPAVHNCVIRLGNTSDSGGIEDEGRARNGRKSHEFYALTQHLSALSPTYFGKRIAAATAAASATAQKANGEGGDGQSGANSTSSTLLELRLEGEHAMLDPAQVEDFLNAVALEGRLKPTPDNVLSLLSLAHRFQVPQLRRDCEEHLRHACHLPLMQRLLLCARYDLRELRAHLICTSLTKTRWLRLLVEEAEEVLIQLDSRLLAGMLKRFL